MKLFLLATICFQTIIGLENENCSIKKYLEDVNQNQKEEMLSPRKRIELSQLKKLLNENNSNIDNKIECYKLKKSHTILFGDQNFDFNKYKFGKIVDEEKSTKETEPVSENSIKKQESQNIDEIKDNRETSKDNFMIKNPINDDYSMKNRDTLNYDLEFKINDYSKNNDNENFDKKDNQNSKKQNERKSDAENTSRKTENRKLMDKNERNEIETNEIMKNENNSGIDSGNSIETKSSDNMNVINGVLENNIENHERFDGNNQQSEKESESENNNENVNDSKLVEKDEKNINLKTETNEIMSNENNSGIDNEDSIKTNPSDNISMVNKKKKEASSSNISQNNNNEKLIFQEKLNTEDTKILVDNKNHQTEKNSISKPQEINGFLENNIENHESFAINNQQFEKELESENNNEKVNDSKLVDKDKTNLNRKTETNEIMKNENNAGVDNEDSINTNPSHTRSEDNKNEIKESSEELTQDDNKNEIKNSRKFDFPEKINTEETKISIVSKNHHTINDNLSDSLGINGILENKVENHEMFDRNKDKQQPEKKLESENEDNKIENSKLSKKDEKNLNKKTETSEIMNNENNSDISNEKGREENFEELSGGNNNNEELNFQESIKTDKTNVSIEDKNSNTINDNLSDPPEINSILENKVEDYEKFNRNNQQSEKESESENNDKKVENLKLMDNNKRNEILTNKIQKNENNSNINSDDLMKTEPSDNMGGDSKNTKKKISEDPSQEDNKAKMENIKKSKFSETINTDKTKISMGNENRYTEENKMSDSENNVENQEKSDNDNKRTYNQHSDKVLENNDDKVENLKLKDINEKNQEIKTNEMMKNKNNLEVNNKNLSKIKTSYNVDIDNEKQKKVDSKNDLNTLNDQNINIERKNDKNNDRENISKKKSNENIQKVSKNNRKINRETEISEKSPSVDKDNIKTSNVLDNSNNINYSNDVDKISHSKSNSKDSENIGKSNIKNNDEIEKLELKNRNESSKISETEEILQNNEKTEFDQEEENNKFKLNTNNEIPFITEIKRNEVKDKIENVSSDLSGKTEKLQNLTEKRKLSNENRNQNEKIDEFKQFQKQDNFKENKGKENQFIENKKTEIKIKKKLLKENIKDKDNLKSEMLKNTSNNVKNINIFVESTQKLKRFCNENITNEKSIETLNKNIDNIKQLDELIQDKNLKSNILKNNKSEEKIPGKLNEEKLKITKKHKVNDLEKEDHYKDDLVNIIKQSNHDKESIIPYLIKIINLQTLQYKNNKIQLLKIQNKILTKFRKEFLKYRNSIFRLELELKRIDKILTNLTKNSIIDNGKLDEILEIKIKLNQYENSINQLKYDFVRIENSKKGRIEIKKLVKETIVEEINEKNNFVFPENPRIIVNEKLKAFFLTCRFLKVIGFKICCRYRKSKFHKKVEYLEKITKRKITSCNNVEEYEKVITISPKDSINMEKECLCRNKSIVILQRRSGNINFTRTWTEYKNGFGKLSDSFWIGLELIYQLTHEKHFKLHVHIKDWDNKTFYANYAHFKINSEHHGYELHVKGYSGNSGDSLIPHNGKKFSTIDADHDEVTKNFGGSCSNRFRGGWWYYSCYKCNPTGVFYDNGNVTHKQFDGISWKTLRPPNYSFQEFDMSIETV